jgi:hypothetical protein
VILWKEGETQGQIDEANAIIEALDTAYPGHPWGVRVYPGGFFIRHLDFPANFGMNCKGTYASASLLKRDVIMMAGEWLERAGLPRKKWDPESEILRVEGVPEKFQPNPHPQDVEKLKKNIETVIATAEREMRDQPRPQVLELAKK